MIFNQIKEITSNLIELSLCDDHQFPSLKNLPDNFCEVSYSNNSNLSSVLKNVSYSVIYDELLSSRHYNIKMLDGALFQFMYRYKGGSLVSHRLAFFPSPVLEEYQNNPEIYEIEEIYAEILLKSIVAFPIRFDYDPSSQVNVDVHHPKSHLSLGQYKNCRIPVCAPLTPSIFVEFILRSFYNTAHRKFSEKIKKHNDVFDECISANESRILHVSVPSKKLNLCK